MKAKIITISGQTINPEFEVDRSSIEVGRTIEITTVIEKQIILVQHFLIKKLEIDAPLKIVAEEIASGTEEIKPEKEKTDKVTKPKKENQTQTSNEENDDEEECTCDGSGNDKDGNPCIKCLKKQGNL